MESGSNDDSGDSRRSWNRDDVRAARNDPSKGKLAGGDALSLCDRLDSVNESVVVLEVLFLKPTERTAHVTG